MPAELLINALPTAIRIAYCEAGQLQALWIERPSLPGLVGAIYRGRICRLLPALQAAFVDIGGDQPAFLPASHLQNLPPLQRSQPCETSTPAISQHLYEGQSLRVQVIKEPLGNKGPKLTTRITLTGRYVVLSPQQRTIQVSRRIDCPQERERLIMLASAYSPGTLGWMIRTAAAGVEAAAITQEMVLLHQQWQTVLQTDHSGQGIKRLYAAPPRVQSLVRDYASAELAQVVVDCPTLAAQLLDFSRQWLPDLSPKIKAYQGEIPLFQQRGIESAIQETLGCSVALPSGGDLLIEQTSALTVIDVNSGSFVGAPDPAALAVQTNLEAAQAIARQLRLRHLGGIIVIDFMKLSLVSHRQQVLAALRQALARDRVKTTLGGFSPLGLVEMSRQQS